MSGYGGAALGLLLTGLGCQALVDVSQYRFDRDGGVDTDPSQPPPASDEVEEPAAAQDAGKGGAASAPVSETPPMPPLLPPRPAADGGTESSGGDQEPPSSDDPDSPPEAPDAGATPEDPPPVPDPPPEAPEPVPNPPPADPPPDTADNCSRVEYCEANTVLDTIDQERCLQRGCSVEAAIVECREEVYSVCGNVQPPFAFYTLEGVRLELQ